MVPNHDTLTAARAAYTDRLYESKIPGTWFDTLGAFNSDGGVSPALILEEGGVGTARDLLTDNYLPVSWSVEDGQLRVNRENSFSTTYVIRQKDGYLELKWSNDDASAVLLKDLFLDVNLSEVDVNDYFAWTTASQVYTDTYERGDVTSITSAIVPENLLYDEGWMFFMVSDDNFAMECSYPSFKEYYLIVHREGQSSSTSRTISGATENIGFSPFSVLYSLNTAHVSTGDGQEDRVQTITTSLLPKDVSFTNASGHVIYINKAYVTDTVPVNGGFYRGLKLAFSGYENIIVGSWFVDLEY